MKYLFRIRILATCLVSVILLLSLFSCKPTNVPEEPKTPDEMVAAVFGDEPYSLSYESWSGKVVVSNIILIRTLPKTTHSSYPKRRMVKL